ncbi:rap guanine nucleotide exchange factor 5 isoform X1 [Salmo salar]|uniref:Rap guanine nucleotide exchange factor 5 isoform X1 n=2 Tax=Salmo salar TaxID=8030 RepID=A0A1S3Q172_SALSA|nr:rap guanine nucleotide exchange factor 5 isoform X1 [Salmo salar]|eukprot:XP_014033705.1 PREDICTED: rap guanine nucleotide exchange factor 5-like isoform X1 [Salmo salar]
MEDSESGGEDGMVGGSRWNNRNTGARDQTQLRQKIRDLPGLLKHGLHLRKKSQSPDTIPGPSTSPTVHKSCSQSFPCAGRAVRNAFLSHGPYPAKDKIHLARIIRRSYVGVELVQWLCEQCVYVRCRSMAVRVWQVLLELGILLSVDQRVVFGDSNSYYQFSFEECESAACEFCGLEKEAWPEAVRLLLQLVPYVQFRTGSEEDSEGNRDVCGDSFLQMKALERLTATVQNELAAALARKARKAMAEQGGQESPDSTPRQSPTTNEENTMLGGGCSLRGNVGSVCVRPDGVCGREELTRLELVQRLAKDGCRLLQNQNYIVPDHRNPTGEAVGRVCLKERGRDVLVLQRVTSPNPASSPSSVTSPDPASSPSGGGAREEDGEKRYVVVSGTPLKILEHLLSDLRLDDQRGAPESRVSELLLDDFLLTYLVFMTTNDLCQALLGHYSSKRVHGQGQEDGKEALYRKRKVLHLVAHWTRLYKDFLREDEHIKAFMKTLSRCVLEDLYEFPSLEKDMKEFQKLLRRRHTVDECPPQQKSKPLFQQLSLKENSLPLRFPRADTKEVLCRVYVSADSYLCVYTHSLLSVAELLRIVGQKMDRPEEDMVLVTHTPTGERRMLQAGQYVYSETLTPQSKLMVCRRDLTHIMAPLTDSELSRRTVRLLGINTWDMAAVLTQLDWNLFNSIHEQELVYSTMSCSTGGSHREGLSVLLQRCNEVQQWVMSEVLMCVSLNKRVQLLKKFIKIAAHCKAQRNLNSAFAIIMGLNTAAVSRLNITWEKVPGKFKKIFSELELITDPSLNHKAYRDAFKKMKPPKIPFMPLLLKDITFIHEGNKTFQDNLVNFQKLHMIADTVRLIRHCQSDQLGNEVVGSDSAEVRASVHYLHIIDNQQTLFQLSHKLEPRA